MSCSRMYRGSISEASIASAGRRRESLQGPETTLSDFLSNRATIHGLASVPSKSNPTLIQVWSINTTVNSIFSCLVSKEPWKGRGSHWRWWCSHFEHWIVKLHDFLIFWCYLLLLSNKVFFQLENILIQNEFGLLYRGRGVETLKRVSSLKSGRKTSLANSRKFTRGKRSC